MSISRNSITLINPDEGDGATARQTKIDFMGFSDGEVDINDVFSGVGATSQSTGSGLNDITFQGTYTGTTAVTYYVKIDATGTPDTFSWSKDNFTSTEATGVSLTGSAQTLDTGVTVTAGATTGHTLNDVWQVTTVVDITDPHVLAQILVDHEGTSADDKGEIAIKVNDGNDGQAPSKTVMTGHANGDVTFGGSATITGDLTVSGTTTTISTTNLVIEDKVMTLNDGGAAASGGSVGLEVEENVEADSAINQDVTSDAGPTFAGVTSTGAIDITAGVGVNVGSDAEGDIYFRNSSGNFARLAPGTSGYFLKTQGASNPPVWGEVAETNPGGSDTQVQYNGSGSFAGDAGMTYNAGTDTLTVGALTESSDVTLKENISEYQSKEALQAVMAMQSHRYTWKENGVEEIGLIADEVENIIPELVTTRSMDNMKSLKYSKLVAVLSEAMKEQQNQIEELKAEIKALKN